MSHTYASNRIHAIFSTKQRQKRLREDIQPKLWAYIAGIARNHNFEAIEIGGAEDHCHALILLPAPMPLFMARSASARHKQTESSNTSRANRSITRNAITRKNFWNF